MYIYLLIDNHHGLSGIFSSMDHLKALVLQLIKDSYEENGYHGWYHFRYAKIKLNEPWFTENGEAAPMKENRAMLSLWTMHPEYFIHTIENDPNTGEILDWDKIKDYEK